MHQSLVGVLVPIGNLRWPGHWGGPGRPGRYRLLSEHSKHIINADHQLCKRGSVFRSAEGENQ